MSNLLEKASIITTPTAYSDGKLHSVKPVHPLGDELVTNGDFATDSDWSKSSNWTISGGKAIADGSSQGALTQTLFTPIIGKEYLLSYEISDYLSGNIRVYYGGVFTNFATSNGIYNEIIKATSTDSLFQTSIGSPFNGSIDNVSVKEVTDADFDFQRGSAATRVNSQGLIENVQTLSGNLVQNGDFSEIGSEEVANGDFATDSDWTLGNGSYISQGSLILPNTGTAIQTGIPTNKMVRLDVQGSGNITYRLSTGVSFQQISLPQTIYLTTGSSGGRVQFSNTSGSEVKIDNVSVKEVGQNWSFGTGWSIGDGEANFTGSAYGDSILQNDVSIFGKTYAFDCDLTNGSFDIKIGSNSYFVYSGQTLYITADNSGASDAIVIRPLSSNITITNISVIEITDDTDLPRIDYTDGCGSLLLEPQRTNLFPYSNSFTNWSVNNGALISSNVIISPDGTLNADKLSVGTTNVSPFILQNTSVIATETYTQTIYAKSGDADVLQITGSTGYATYFQNYNLSNGTLGNNNIDSPTTKASIEYVGNGWYRCIYTTVGGLTTTSGRIVFAIVSEGSGRLGGSGLVANTGLYIYGAQLEVGSYKTSYIPTNGSTATRLADVCNNAGSSDLINSTEGVLYAEISALANDLTRRIITITDGTLNNIVKLEYKNVSNQIEAVLYNGTTQCLILHTLSDETEFNKIAFKYKQNDFSLFINGVRVGTDINGVVFAPNTLNNLSFYQGNSNNLYGKVKSVVVFKEALTNDELEGLTGEGYDTFNALALANNYTII